MACQLSESLVVVLIIIRILSDKQTNFSIYCVPMDHLSDL